jgi:hypothetical protein
VDEILWRFFVYSDERDSLYVWLLLVEVFLSSLLVPKIVRNAASPLESFEAKRLAL